MVIPVKTDIEFWAKVEKCALDNSDLPIEFIKDILMAIRFDKSVAEPFEYDHT